MIKVLIVEDDDNKLTVISKLLASKNFELDSASSFKDAQNKIFSSKYDLVILDMSIPTFDKTLSDKGGKWRSLGGEELLDEMQRFEISSKVFVVTAYDKLGVGESMVTFWQLKKRLKENFPDLFIGGAYFDTFETEWELHIKKMLEKEFGV